MLIEVKVVAVAKSDLKKIVIEAFFGDSYFFCRLFKRVFLMLPTLIAGSRIVLSPFYNFFDDVSDSALFGSSASFSFDLIVLFTDFFLFVISVGLYGLGVHESIDVHKS